MVAHLDLIATYGALALTGLAVLSRPARAPRAALTPSWEVPVAIAPAPASVPVFCEAARRWRDPVTRRFVKAPVL